MVLPVGVTSIGDWAFSGCLSLEEVVIPQSVMSIGKNTFYNCASFKKVESLHVFEKLCDLKTIKGKIMRLGKPVFLSNRHIFP